MYHTLNTHKLFKRSNFNDSRYKIFKRYQDKGHITKWERLHSVHWTSGDITGVGSMITGKNQKSLPKVCWNKSANIWLLPPNLRHVSRFSCMSNGPLLLSIMYQSMHATKSTWSPMPSGFWARRAHLKPMAMWRLHIKVALLGLTKDANQQTPKKNAPGSPSQ